MAIRMQQRRGTAEQWTLANPVLGPGEIGFELDSNSFKIGDGVSTWEQLDYFQNAVTLGGSIDDYIPLTQRASANGVATLDAQGQVPASQLGYVDQAVENIIGMAPESLNSLAELAEAINEDPDFFNTIEDNIDAARSDAQVYTDTALLDYAQLSGATFTGAVVLPADPTNALEAATKAYVDGVATGLHIHESVVAATTANIDLSNSLENGDVLDGVTLATGNRVLVKNQTDKSQNGIYVVQASGAAVRATDYDSPAEIDAGDFVFVNSGTVNADTGWTQTNTVGTIGTDPVEFTQFSGAGTYLSGLGLELNGNVFSVDLDYVSSKTFSEQMRDDAIGLAQEYTDGEITTLQTTLNSSIGLVSDSLDSAILAINANDQDIETINTSLGTISSDISDLQTEVSAIDSVVDGHDTTINTLVTTVEGNTSNIDLLLPLVDDVADLELLKAPLESPTFTGTVALPSTTSIGNVTDTEIGYLDGVTSGIQAQIDAKADAATVSSTYAPINNPTFTGTVELPTDTSVGNVSSTELGHLNNVTSNIQDQLDDKAPLESPTFTGTVSGVTKAHVGLGNVDNTSDADKPVSTATQAALDTKANLAGATFTGDVTIETDLVVDGDLTVNGTNFSASATSIVIEDNLVQLAHQNAANTVDLGIVVGYNDGSAKHAGIVRDVSANIWKLFKGVDTEPATTVDFTQGSLDDLAVNNISVAGVQFSDGTQTKVGVHSITEFSQKTASYTLDTLSHINNIVEMDSSSATTFTIPTDAALAWPVGASMDIFRIGSGEVTISGDSGVTVNFTPGNKLRAQWSSATILKRGANSWVLYGDLKV